MESIYTKPQLKKYIFPLIKTIKNKHKKNKTLIIGIQGGQGTGKTTLVDFLEKKLEQNYKVRSFSIDDFYKTYRERKRLSKKHKNSPFYQIPRGMPGTHSIRKLKNTLGKIKKGKPFEIPEFDKSLQNAAGDISRKTKVKQKQDFVFFEGWCLGLPYITPKILIQHCKKHNIKIDYKKKHLQALTKHIKPYIQLWKYIDFYVMLQPSSASLHKKWRYEQEKELKKEKKKGMTKKEINHFVDIYLSLTYVCYNLVKPDIKIFINKNHRFYKIKKN